jgi:hypothetical protein
MRVGPTETEDVGEESLRQTVASHHLIGQLQAVGGEGDRVVGGRDQTDLGHLLDHLRHRGATDVEAFGDAGPDDLEVVLVQLENALAVFLEGRVSVGGRDHGRSVPLVAEGVMGGVGSML